MRYTITVGFETDQLDKATGENKTKNAKFLVDGETLYEAMMNMTEYLKTDSRGHNIRSITEAKFEDVLTAHNGKVTAV